MGVNDVIQLVGGNAFAAVMLYLYIVQLKEHKELIRAKDAEIKALNDSINEKVIQMLDEQRKYLSNGGDA